MRSSANWSAKQAFCKRRDFEDGALVTESKVVAWLQDEVLQRTTSSSRVRGSRRRPIGHALQAELAVEGPQSPGHARDSSDSEAEPSSRLAPLKYETVKVYSAAIAELYHTQVSMGLNRAPSFRGVAFKGLMRDLQRTQEKRSRETFEDRGAGGIAAGYTLEEFLYMQDQLLSGAKGSIQVSKHLLI
jgi:hypothetical protein